MARRPEILNSNCLGTTKRGSITSLIAHYASKGREAEASGDSVLAQYFFNHEEHWKRMLRVV